MTSLPPHSALGLGSYTIPEAARLLKIPPVNIRRWMGGYRYSHAGETRTKPPLWKTELVGANHHIELSFRDLIELKFVREFMCAGLKLPTIRYCLRVAHELFDTDRPFLHRRFETDGRTIFLKVANSKETSELLDLKKKQYAFETVIAQTFRDLDIRDDEVASWRPFRGKKSIVIDPQRSFGQPLTNEYGVPTIVLAQAVEAEGSIPKVSRLFEVSVAAVRDAVNFERSLMAA